MTSEELAIIEARYRAEFDVRVTWATDGTPQAFDDIPRLIDALREAWAEGGTWKARFEEHCTLQRNDRAEWVALGEVSEREECAKLVEAMADDLSYERAGALQLATNHGAREAVYEAVRRIRTRGEEQT